jgi:hypothetical protein
MSVAAVETHRWTREAYERMALLGPDGSIRPLAAPPGAPIPVADLLP